MCWFRARGYGGDGLSGFGINMDRLSVRGCTLNGPIRANRFAIRTKHFSGESTFQKMDSSEDWTRITRISMRIGEKTHSCESGKVLQK